MLWVVLLVFWYFIDDPDGPFDDLVGIDDLDGLDGISGRRGAARRILRYCGTCMAAKAGFFLAGEHAALPWLYSSEPQRC